MIPTHSSQTTSHLKLILNKLSTVNSYDFDHPHRHTYFEFFVFIKGGGNHRIDSEMHNISDASIQIVAPGQVHQVQRTEGSLGYVFLFELNALTGPRETTDFLLQHIYSIGNQIDQTYSLSDHQLMLATLLLEDAFKKFETKAQDNQLVIQNTIQRLCLFCLENSNFKPVDSTFCNFQKLVHQHFRSFKKISDYAQALQISERKLNELTKSITGKSATKIINEYKIQEAKRLLLIDSNVKEVAYDLGFTDAAHFSKFFNQQLGLYPTDFKNLHVKG